ADRLLQPELKGASGSWAAADWSAALEAAVQQLRTATGGDFSELGILASPSATTEELFLVGELARKLGCGNVDHRLRQSDFSAGAVPPTLDQSIEDLEKSEAVLVV